MLNKGPKHARICESWTDANLSFLIGDKQAPLAHSRSSAIEIFKGMKIRACLSLRSVGSSKPCGGQQQDRTLTTE